MSKKVIISPNAELELLSISKYLLLEFGVFTLNHFLNLYDDKVKLIASYPLRYPLINKKNNIRKAVLNRHCIILYTHMGEVINIVSVFDTRQNPDKIGRLK